jgi:hypothetical protein
LCCSKVREQYIPQKHKWFGIYTYNLRGSVGYNYNIAVYWGRDRVNVTATMMATHAAMTELIN